MALGQEGVFKTGRPAFQDELRAEVYFVVHFVDVCCPLWWLQLWSVETWWSPQLSIPPCV